MRLLLHLATTVRPSSARARSTGRPGKVTCRPAGLRIWLVGTRMRPSAWRPTRRRSRSSADSATAARLSEARNAKAGRADGRAACMAGDLRSKFGPQVLLTQAGGRRQGRALIDRPVVLDLLTGHCYTCGRLPQSYSRTEAEDAEDGASCRATGP